jgi:hypothetical protein
MNEELKSADQPARPESNEPKPAGGPVTSTALSDADLSQVAGGPTIKSSAISTITDLADDDLRRAAGGPRMVNE